MRPRFFSLQSLAWLCLAALVGFSQPACDGRTVDQSCQNTSTFVPGSEARQVLSVDLPFSPGPVAVLWEDDTSSLRHTTSGRLWLGEGGTTLYAVDGAAVRAVDLATWDVATLASVGYRAGQLAGSHREAALLVTDQVRGSLWILDSTLGDPPLEVPVGRGPSALALGPGRRIAYVANAWDDTLSLVDTGLGAPLPTDRRVLVASASGGQLLVLDGDGRTRQRFDGLPGHLSAMALLPGAELLAVTYSDVLVTGERETPGDGQILLSEGVALLHLESGQVSLHPIARTSGPSDLLAHPAGLAVVNKGSRLLVALPGWGSLAVYNLDPSTGSLDREPELLQVPGNPRWVVAASLATDWAYLLDDDTGLLLALSPGGETLAQVYLR